jgi:hypothetical protein
MAVAGLPDVSLDVLLTEISRFTAIFSTDKAVVYPPYREEIPRSGP